MLKVEQLRAGYGALEVLHGISFQVAPGEIVAVLGANGAGKSTLLRALAGVLRTSSGSITLDGHPLERVSADQRVRRGMTLVPEGRELFGSLTVRENLIMGAFTRRSSTELAADIDRMLGYFPRLRQRIDAKAASLSGGEGQMLAISRALMSHPRLLLLDEPSQGLAPAIVDVVFDVLARLNAETGLTLLLVEQNARRALTLARHAYVMQGGTFALAGTPTALAENPAVRELYLGGHAPHSESITDGASG